jgi:hypothetical protein
MKKRRKFTAEFKSKVALYFLQPGAMRDDGATGLKKQIPSSSRPRRNLCFTFIHTLRPIKP